SWSRCLLLLRPILLATGRESTMPCLEMSPMVIPPNAGDRTNRPPILLTCCRPPAVGKMPLISKHGPDVVSIEKSHARRHSQNVHEPGSTLQAERVYLGGNSDEMQFDRVW